MSNKIQDRFGMTLSTSSTSAAECWQDGADRLLSQNHGPDLKFKEAIELDEGFAMAHSSLAFWLQQRAHPDEANQSTFTIYFRRTARSPGDWMVLNCGRNRSRWRRRSNKPFSTRVGSSSRRVPALESRSPIFSLRSSASSSTKSASSSLRTQSICKSN